MKKGLDILAAVRAPEGRSDFAGGEQGRCHAGGDDAIGRARPLFDVLGGRFTHVGDVGAGQVAKAANQVIVGLNIGAVAEAGQLQLAPSTSTTAMLALGDALALVTSQRRGFRKEDFARFHPGGALGRQLARVEDLMRPLEQCRVALDRLTIRHVLVSLGRPGRRCR